MAPKTVKHQLYQSKCVPKLITTAATPFFFDWTGRTRTDGHHSHPGFSPVGFGALPIELLSHFFVHEKSGAAFAVPLSIQFSGINFKTSAGGNASTGQN